VSWSLLRTILILPGTALVYVPALLLWLFAGTRWAMVPARPTDVGFWLGWLIGGAGFALAVWTVRLFATHGRGTPAPWNPPRRLVVRGPYRHVRNPMISAVLAMQLAEALLLGSWPLLGWAAVFFIANAIYFPLSEEKGLERRFGEAYQRYAANVPRWFPRSTPWVPD
jgi:protein-S-isoprenylcysteine O-methyltransferase Ste14